MYANTGQWSQKNKKGQGLRALGGHLENLLATSRSSAQHSINSPSASRQSQSQQKDKQISLTPLHPDSLAQLTQNTGEPKENAPERPKSPQAVCECVCQILRRLM